MVRASDWEGPMRNTSSHSHGKLAMRPTPRIINFALVEALVVAHLGKLKHEVIVVLVVISLITVGWFFL
jgi:hypothetical protein